MKFTRVFGELRNTDAAIAGGKGASLGEMTQAGIPVPTGFVVTAETFDFFLKETDLIAEIAAILSRVNHEEIHTVERASEEIQALIFTAAMPNVIADEVHEQFKALNTEFVAVRSSATAEDGATAAWAGQLDTFLNTTKETLTKHVQECWASLYTPRAIFYRFEKGLRGQDISVAVVVQNMVNSEAAGIAFSVHPVTGDYNQMIIEAGFGLGEAVVSGQVTPDSYVVTKDDRQILDVNVSEQGRGLFRKEGGGNEWRELSAKAGEQVLTNEQILALTDLVCGIEKLYGFPVDVEWAVESGEIYIVQSRPITTLSSTRSFGEAPSVPSAAEALVSSKENDFEGAITKVSVFGHISEWQRLFRVPGLRYFINDIWVDHYKTLDVLITVLDSEYTSYLPLEWRAKTRADGIKLLQSDASYKEYETEFREYMASFKEYAAAFPYEEASREDVEMLIARISHLFFYYSRTEFFYTDGAYERFQETNDPVLGRNLEKMGDLKNDGRAFLNDIFFGSASVLPRLLSALENRFGVPEKVLQQYSRAEMLALFDGRRVSEVDIERRNNAFYMLSVKGKLHIVVGEAARGQIETFQAGTTNIDEAKVSGIIANRGKVTGRARVIRSGYDNFDSLHGLMEEMNAGDILIAETTSPELMPACKKAGAIATEQGGLLSHAAIVSRELQIPCVVGVEGATDLVRNGDLLEVDGDTGTISIIERAHHD